MARKFEREWLAGTPAERVSGFRSAALEADWEARAERLGEEVERVKADVQRHYLGIPDKMPRPKHNI